MEWANIGLTIHSSCLLRDVEYSTPAAGSRVNTPAHTSLRLTMWPLVTHHISAAGYRSLIKIDTARYHSAVFTSSAGRRYTSRCNGVRREDLEAPK